MQQPRQNKFYIFGLKKLSYTQLHNVDRSGETHGTNSIPHTCGRGVVMTIYSKGVWSRRSTQLTAQIASTLADNFI